MFRRATLVLLLFFAFIALTTYAQNDNDEFLSTVCLVLNIDEVEDGTFSQSAYEGMIDIAEDYGLAEDEAIYLPSESMDDHAPNIQQCLDDGFDIIITIGFQLADVTYAAAEENPDRYFIGVDHFLIDGPENYAGIQFRDDEAGFLVGYLAGLMTESNTIAGIYGPPVPPLVRWRNGFEQGARHAAEETGKDLTILGRYMDDFDLPDEGAEAAAEFIEAGADVIFGAGGPTGSGGIKYAAQEGVWVIGVDQDEYYTTFEGGEVEGADRLITSALKRVDVGVYDMLSVLVDGRFDEFPGGSNYVLTIENSGISFANTHEADVPDEYIEQLIEVEEMLAEGELTTGVDPETGELLEEGDGAEATPEATEEVGTSTEPQLRNDEYLDDISFLTGEPCAAPCWRGITPGETSWEDAIAIIEDDPTLDNLQQRQGQDTDRVGAAWSKTERDLCCQMFSSEDGQTVELILLQISPQATLNSAIEEFGDPDYLTGNTVSDTQGIVSVIYEDTPMYIYVFVAGAGGEINEDSEIIGFVYLTPELMDELIRTSDLHTWDGYATYRDYMDDEVEVTPVPAGEAGDGQ